MFNVCTKLIKRSKVCTLGFKKRSPVTKTPSTNKPNQLPITTQKRDNYKKKYPSVTSLKGICFLSFSLKGA